MTEDAIQRFRITLWPGVKLPHRGLFGAVRVLRDGHIGPTSTTQGDVSKELARFSLDAVAQQELASRVASHARRVGLRDLREVAEAGEIYLELEEVDLDNDEEI